MLDKLISSLTDRISAYEELRGRFGFFVDLTSMDPANVFKGAKNLVEAYPEDVEDALANELVQLASLSQQFQKSDTESVEYFLYRIIVENDLHSTFANAEIALRIYLSMMVTNCSGERSFSKMKIIKNRLRTTMSQDRLANLTLLSLENDILRDLPFESLITTFSHKKSRKVCLY